MHTADHLLPSYPQLSHDTCPHASYPAHLWEGSWLPLVPSVLAGSLACRGEVPARQVLGVAACCCWLAWLQLAEVSWTHLLLLLWLLLPRVVACCC